MKKQYYIIQHVFDPPRTSGTHFIKAESQDNAIEIAKKHGIAFPWGIEALKNVVKTKIELCEDVDRLNRRRLGIGGRVWMEDVHGNLGYEDENLNFIPFII